MFERVRNSVLTGSGFRVSDILGSCLGYEPSLFSGSRWANDYEIKSILVACAAFQVGPTELLAVEDEMKQKMEETGSCREVSHFH